MSILAKAFLNKWASETEVENKNPQISWGINQTVSFDENVTFQNEEGD